jgi:ubiquinone/menaquinone biosynthesis C-methylase UbiE
MNGTKFGRLTHEVKSIADKKSVLQEAIRVVKPGGNFAFVDYFYDQKYYGKKSEYGKFLKDHNLAVFYASHLAT